MQEKKEEKRKRKICRSCRNAAPMRKNLKRAGGLQSVSPEKLIMGKVSSCIALKASLGHRDIVLSLGFPVPAATAVKNVQKTLNHPALTVPDRTC